MRWFRFITVFLLAALWSGSAMALTMQEAVQTALEHNNAFEQQRQLARSADEQAGVARAPFYPFLDLSYSYTKSDQTSAFSPSKENSVFTVQGSYLLFHGMSDLYSAEAASLQAEAAGYRTRSVRADTILAAKSAYIQVLRAGHAVDTSREGVDLLKKQLEDAKRFFDVGLIAKNDLLKVEVELASAQQDLVQAEGSHRVALSQLERVMGVPLAADVTLEDFKTTPKKPAIAFDALRQEMLGNRSEVKFLKAQAGAAGKQMKAAEGGYLPSVSLALQYNQYGDSATPDGRKFFYDDETLTLVTAKWNLFNGFATSHAVSSARALQRAAEAQLKDTEQQLVFQARQVMENYGVAEQKYKVAQAAVAQAEENYRVTDASFKHNVATTTDLLDARTLLSRARTQYFGALYDLHLSQAELERVLEQESSRGEVTQMDQAAPTAPSGQPTTEQAPAQQTPADVAPLNQAPSAPTPSDQVPPAQAPSQNQ